MKKTLILTLALCLTLAALLGFTLGRDSLNKAFASAESTESAEQAEPAEGAEQTEQAEDAGRLDYEAILALHEPDEVVLTIGERAITWDEYFYYLYRQATSIESYFDNMALYGLTYNWGDIPDEESQESYADYAIESTVQTAVSISAIGGFAEQMNLTLSEENIAAIAEKEAADYEAACGEGATREDFEGFLKEIYMPVSLYDYMNRISVLYQQGYLDLYGENGEKLSDEDALAWMEGEAYMAANHILLLTMDMSSREALSDEQKAEKLAKAQELAEELKAIEDRETLLARFAELKEEFDEDTGKVAYPNGYVFTPGTMVSEFEEATKSQDAYQVSDPVESTYGYHIIMTLPLDPDAVIQYTSAGTPQSARALAANELYTAAVDAYAMEQSVVWSEGFETPDLLSFVK